jgi:hypothetical protein
MEEQPPRRKGAGWMLHMAEMAVVQDVPCPPEMAGPGEFVTLT